MDDIKKVLLSIISVAGAIYELYSFCNKNKEEINNIVKPAIEACKEVKDIKLIK